ncbi:type III secretion system stator protein SctL [Siccibacter turicensis]|uniref:type III secretion system stator protein SctL n=1 Tax=Siccibacter turicensis TaxID=357233 RepID=UPI003F55512F
MWKIKPIALLGGAVPDGPVLPREVLADHRAAQQILAAAHEQAAAILEAAREQAEHELATQRLSYEAQFWQQADEVLAGWQAQRQQEEAQLVTLADRLLNDALHQLLGDVPRESRFHALLHQLLRHHPRQQQATLYCAQSQEQALSDWLAEQPQLEWTLCGDPALEADALRLVTDRGELYIAWSTLREQFTRQPAPAL